MIDRVLIAMNYVSDGMMSMVEMMGRGSEPSYATGVMSPNLSTAIPYSVNSSTTNYNLNVSSQQQSAGIVNDFTIMQVLA